MAAIEMARQAGHRGEEAQVLLQNEDGTFDLKWTYGIDPYNP